MPLKETPEKEEQREIIADVSKIFLNSGYKISQDVLAGIAGEPCHVNKNGVLVILKTSLEGPQIVIGSKPQSQVKDLFDENDEALTPGEVLSGEADFYIGKRLYAGVRGNVFKIEQGKRDDSIISKIRRGMERLWDDFYG